MTNPLITQLGKSLLARIVLYGALLLLIMLTALTLYRLTQNFGEAEGTPLAPCDHRIDLGKVLAGDSCPVVCKVRNVSTSTWQLARLETQCSCTVASHQEGQVVRPGEKIAISVSVDVPRKPGTFTNALVAHFVEHLSKQSCPVVVSIFGESTSRTRLTPISPTLEVNNEGMAYVYMVGNQQFLRRLPDRVVIEGDVAERCVLLLPKPKRTPVPEPVTMKILASGLRQKHAMTRVKIILPENGEILTELVVRARSAMDIRSYPPQLTIFADEKQIPANTERRVLLRSRGAPVPAIKQVRGDFLLGWQAYRRADGMQIMLNLAFPDGNMQKSSLSLELRDGSKIVVPVRYIFFGSL